MLALLLSTVLCTPAHAEGPDWKVLRQTEVQASSFLHSNWNKYSENYHPNYVADENPRTAWVEGVPGNGEGESILLPTHIISGARAVRLRIRNGYQKSEGLLKANAAPKDVRIAVLFADEEVAHTSVSLERKMGWQEVVVPLPEGKGLSAVSLRVDSVHPGSKYKDTCISDIVVEADTDVPYRPAIEAARLQKLLAWTQERKKTAAYFASLPATYPFASTAFKETRNLDADPVLVERKRAMEGQAREAAETGSWWARTAKQAPVTAPDGLYGFSDYLLPLLSPDQLAWFETDQRYARQTGRRGKQTDYSYTTHARLSFHKDGTTPKTIWFEHYKQYMDRGFVKERWQYFAQCDLQGRPSHILVSRDTDSDLIVLRWSEAGKIDQITKVFSFGIQRILTPKD